MNGMKAKAARLKNAKRFTPEGLPRDAKDWLVADWIDLHRAMKWVERRIRERHRNDRKRT